mmetsp:Transcript_18412/g.45979  ORF Transcript_18412/g.45979 Transcript_18412/m.45979 type:complete len:225 (-) Transcript_18412:430-1104(-)
MWQARPRGVPCSVLQAVPETLPEVKGKRDGDERGAGCVSGPARYWKVFLSAFGVGGVRDGFEVLRDIFLPILSAAGLRLAVAYRADGRGLRLVLGDCPLLRLALDGDVGRVLLQHVRPMLCMVADPAQDLRCDPWPFFGIFILLASFQAREDELPDGGPALQSIGDHPHALLELVRLHLQDTSTTIPGILEDPADHDGGECVEDASLYLVVALLLGVIHQREAF